MLISKNYAVTQFLHNKIGGYQLYFCVHRVFKTIKRIKNQSEATNDQYIRESLHYNESDLRILYSSHSVLVPVIIAPNPGLF